MTRREKLVEELLTSERAHVQNLNAFVQDYVIPLRDKKILSTDDLQSILCNLELIRSWNVEFLHQLESAIDDERGFGDLFLEMVHLVSPAQPYNLLRPAKLLPLSWLEVTFLPALSCQCFDSFTHSTTKTTLTPCISMRSSKRTKTLLPSSRSPPSRKKLVALLAFAHFLLGETNYPER